MSAGIGDLRLLPSNPGPPRTDRDLVEAGWTRRFQADEARAREALEIYEGMGLDVRMEPLAPGDFPSGCGECVEVSARETWLVYTRPPAQER